jgi:signal transduction histidine kinase
MSNAIEASERGQEVRVGADIKEDFLRKTIRDDGSGMDKEALGNIFIPFF